MVYGSNSSLVRALNKLVSLTRACKPAKPNAIRPKVLTTAALSEKLRKNKKQIKRNVIAALIAIVSLALLRKIA
jgi:predicted metal-binding transcription factor (methanogenesis marker protein 9)